MEANLAEEHRRLQKRHQRLRDEVSAYSVLVSDLMTKIELRCAERGVRLDDDIYDDADDIIHRPINFR